MLTMNCSVGAATFRMLVSNDWGRFRVETMATKEPETVDWILENFRAGDTLFDIGANIGIYSILAATWNPEGTVVAVEPMPATFAHLCQNAAVNALQNLLKFLGMQATPDGDLFVARMGVISGSPGTQLALYDENGGLKQKTVLEHPWNLMLQEHGRIRGVVMRDGVSLDSVIVRSGQ